MVITLNVKQRTAIMAVLKAKKSEDLDVLLEYREKSKFFELTEEEKAQIEWKEIPNMSATYKDEKDGEQFKLNRDFDLDKSMVRAIISQTKEFAKSKMITSAHDDILSVYEILSAPSADAKS